MIKILFFLERLSFGGSIGGAEKVLCTLVNHMDKEQFDLTVCTVFPDVASEMLSGDITYKTLFPRSNKLNQFLYRLESALGLTYRLHMKGDYDIEAAYLEYGPTKVIAKSTSQRAKKLAWVHCDFETAIKDKMQFKEKSMAYYRAMDKVMCVSEKTRDSFLSIFGSDFDAEILHNVVDDEEIKGKALSALPDGVEKRRMTLLAVGRLSPPKNYMRLLRTAKKLKEDGFQVDLWIVGDGVEREMMESYIGENHLEDTVALLGFQKNPYPFLREADLLVCSSNYEGYSTFVTEGIILGKPILTTDCSGMHELLGESEYGVIVENDDEAFYQGLKAVLSDAGHQIPMLQQKAAKRSDAFKLEKLVGDTEDFFRNLLAEEK